MPSSPLLTIAQIVPVTEAEGPGRRFALWFQGCPLRCPGCCNPEMLPFAGGTPIAFTDVIARMRDSHAEHKLEGVTLLGGEPFAHANEAAAIADEAHRLELSVMVFSGYVLEELRANPDSSVKALLERIDILVDGPYLRDQPEKKRRWIGSANQRVHFLSDRNSPDDPRWRLPNTVEIRLCDGVVTVNGFPVSGIGLGLRFTMKEVSRFEHNLLRVLRGLVTQASPTQILPILAKPVQRPPCLSADAVALVQDILAKGMVRWLARHGWKQERFLRDGVPASGRMWERTPAHSLGLKYSRWTLEFLLQLMTNTLGSKKPKSDELELGDRLIFLHAYRATLGDERSAKMQSNWPALNGDGLCRLFFVEELREARSARIDWSPWVTGQGVAILESLQTKLASRWADLEARRQTFRDVPRVCQVGMSQSNVLREYLDAIDAVHRRDLARCLLDAGRRVMRDHPPARRWIGNLDLKRERIADRVLIYRDALSFAHVLVRLRAWNDDATSVGYFDEGYAASQLWKADWERFDGEATTNHAAEILREARPM